MLYHAAAPHRERHRDVHGAEGGEHRWARAALLAPASANEARRPPDAKPMVQKKTETAIADCALPTRAALLDRGGRGDAEDGGRRVEGGEEGADEHLAAGSSIDAVATDDATLASAIQRSAPRAAQRARPAVEPTTKQARRRPTRGR